MIDGVFHEYGVNFVRLQTIKGHWKLRYARPLSSVLADIPKGSPVQFEAEKIGGNWVLKTIVTADGNHQGFAEAQQVGNYLPTYKENTMRVSTMFPTKYLSAEDLQGREPVVNMSHVTMEKMQDGTEKPMLHFVGKDKGLVLNKTNASTIAQLYGDDTDLWTGSPIQLFVVHTEYAGKPVLGLRVKAPPRQSGQAPAPATPPAAQGGGSMSEPLDDEIPFIVNFDISKKRGYSV